MQANALLLFACVLVPLWSTSACKRAAPVSQVKVLNGVDDQSSHTASVALSTLSQDGSGGLCSGTLVTSTLVMTAAHCVTADQHGDVVGIRVWLFDAKSYATATAWQANPAYSGNSSEDIAFVTIPPDSIPGASLATLASSAAKVGDELAIVAYGGDQWRSDPHADAATSGAGVRRIGSVKISWISDPPDEVLVVTTTLDPSKKQANILFGDSGSGLYNSDHAIAAIASSAKIVGSGDSTYSTNFLNLYSSKSAAFIKKFLPELYKP